MRVYWGEYGGLGGNMSMIGSFLFGLLVLAVLLHTFYCFARILQRIGFSGWWVLLAGLWPILVPILAYSHWPIEDRIKRNAGFASDKPYSN